MSSAAFKSSSRRLTTTNSFSSKETQTSKKSSSASKKPSPPRRSRSVSAVSRSSSESSSLDFLNARDNPLYCSNVSPPDDVNSEILYAEPKTFDSDNGRGRSVSRNAYVAETVSGNRKDVARSLPRADEGRRRSLSRGPAARAPLFNSESDAELGGSTLTKYRPRNRNESGRKSNLFRTSSSDSLQQVRSSRARSKLYPSPSLSLESSFSEAEERNSVATSDEIKSFQESELGEDTSAHIYETVRSEVRRAIVDIQNELENAIQRGNAAAIAPTNITNNPPDLVNSSAVELVLDIRKEYANKLEQSQDRARKLRADLAVEEHRGLEISRILKEVLPDPKSTDVQKSRPGRKSSIERRKMSKRLTEEAMTYFDECVSLSTFDSSDLSSQEDPPLSSVDICAPVADTSFTQASASVSGNHSGNSWPNDKREWQGACRHGPSGPSATSSSKEHSPEEITMNTTNSQWSNRFQFSFSHNQNGTYGFQHDIDEYVKNFEKDVNSQILRSNNCDLDEYNLKASAQSLLFDRVFFKNKIESGTMLLCDGGATFSLYGLLPL